MWGTIIGFVISALISYYFILPNDILNLKLVDITIGDLLRISGAVVTIIIVTGIGLLSDIGRHIKD